MMKAGDSWDCPHCGNNYFLKKESVMDGWTKTGEVLKCASCGAVVETLSAVREQPESAENSAKTNALAALLGEEVQTAVNPLAGTEKRFCRDCKYRVMNAFRIYCTKHDKDVGPMDDCADYEART